MKHFMLLVFVFLFANQASATITIIKPPNPNINANYVHSSTCPKSDGSSHLTPDPIKNPGEFFRITNVSQSIKDELVNGDTDFKGWTFDFKNDWDSASGKLYIDKYMSVFQSAHFSGAIFQARYIKGATDPVNIRWIQYVTPIKPFDPDGTGPIPPASGGFIDPYPNDSQDNGPFYYHGGNTGTWSIKNYINGSDEFGNYDLKFKDYSRRKHPPVSTNGMNFELYLVAWDGNKHVDFLGGVEWGFVGSCTPEPCSLFLLSIGSLFLRKCD